MSIENELTNILKEEIKKERVRHFQPVRDAFDKHNIGSDDRMNIMIKSQNEMVEHFNKLNRIGEDDWLLERVMFNIDEFVKNR
jgi:hypothetical protein